MEGLSAAFSYLVLYFDHKDVFASIPTHTGRQTLTTHLIRVGGDDTLLTSYFESRQ